MKNFLVFAIFTALVFVVSCGGGSSKPENGGDSVSNFGKLGQECYPNKSCDKGLLCEEETNRCIEDPENPSNSDNENSDNDSIENNDSNPVEENDKDDQPIDNNDTDDIIDDKDDSDVNDNDPIENNDNDNNPSEHDDADNTNDLYGFWEAESFSTKNLTQDEIDDKKKAKHDARKEACPYNYIQQPEQYDQDGRMYIVDKCEGNLDEPMWLENAAPKIIFDLFGVLPPTIHRIVSMSVDYSNKGSQSNMKVRVPGLVLDVNFVSQSCLSQGDTNTSIIEMTPNATDLSAECKIDGEYRASPIETKGTKQAKYLPAEFESLCMSMPNYEMDIYNDACSTTVNDFVWVENVENKLLPKRSNGLWHEYFHTVKSITRDLNTGVFYMDMTLVNGHNEQMNLHITLNNAKSCIDQCHGKECCTSHIEPTSQDASKGCFINGVEVNGEE